MSSVATATTTVATSAAASISTRSDALPLLPASFRAGTNVIFALSPPLPRVCLRAFLRAELSVSRLNDVHGWLWLVGLPIPPRALHVQRLKGREIVVCERADLHLVWQPRRIFVKPLPRYLLIDDFWREQLCAGRPLAGHGYTERGGAATMLAAEEDAEQRELYACALGFLLSYAALVAHESDFRIAKELGLLPEEVTWPQWILFVNELLRSPVEYRQPQPYPAGRGTTAAAGGAAHSLPYRRTTWPHDQMALLSSQVNKRYLYGELRLGRLNLIYRLARGKLLYGYAGSIGDVDGRGRSVSSSDFVRRHLKSLVTLFAYATIVLAAMQVGLATTHARNNPLFQNAAYIFALSAIVSPVLFLAATVAVLMMLMCYYIASTLVFRRQRFAALQAAQRMGNAAGYDGGYKRGRESWVNDENNENACLRAEQMA